MRSDGILSKVEAYPTLKFQVLEVLTGEHSLVLYYVNQNGIKAAEFMQLNATGSSFTNIYVLAGQG